MMRSAILWSAVRNWGPRLGTIITFFVLARILSKNELGLFAAAYSIVSLTEIFADNGFGDAVVRSKNVTFNIATTLWLINIFIACVFYGLLVGFSSQISHLMGVEDLGTILQIVGVTLLINSLGYVPQALLRKSMEFKRLAFRSVAATILGAVVGIAMAFTGFGVYSMVGQLLTSSVINTVFLWYPAVLHPARPQVRGMNEIVRFAFGVFGSRFIGYANTRLIELVIPTLFGPVALAQYIMASRVPAVLSQMLTAVVIDVNLPHMSAMQDRPEEMREALYNTLRSLCVLTVPAFFGMAALSPEISSLAFGSNGEGVAGLMLLIAILGQSQAIYYSNDVFVVASGMPRISLMAQVVTVFLVALVFVIFRDRTLIEMVAAYVATHIIVMTSFICYSSRLTNISLRRFFGTIAPFEAAALVAFFAVYMLRELLVSKVGVLIIEGVLLGSAFLVVYLATVGLISRDALKATIGVLKRKPR